MLVLLALLASLMRHATGSSRALGRPLLRGWGSNAPTGTLCMPRRRLGGACRTCAHVTGAVLPGRQGTLPRLPRAPRLPGASPGFKQGPALRPLTRDTLPDLRRELYAPGRSCLSLRQLSWGAFVENSTEGRSPTVSLRYEEKSLGFDVEAEAVPRAPVVISGIKNSRNVSVPGQPP